MSDLDRYLSTKEKVAPTKLKRRKKAPTIVDRGKFPFSLNKLNKEQIIELLEPLITELPGFAANLAWTRQKILPENPSIHPEELAHILAIPLLEAYILLDQLRSS
jgi:hypothetical protein